MRVIAFTGMPGAGKTDAVAEAKRRGLPIVVMGDFVRAEVRNRGLPPIDENLGRVATEMRQRFGADVWANRTADDLMAQHQKDPLVVIDGVRTLAEVETLRRRLGRSFYLVSIEAPPADRARRLMARARSDAPLSPADVAERDRREISWGIQEAMRGADERLENLGTLAQFEAQVRALFDRLTAGPASATAARSGS